MVDPVRHQNPRAELISKLRQVSTADAADILRNCGVSRIAMRGLSSITPIFCTVVGRARTLRLLPEREDLRTPVNGPVNRGLYDGMLPDEILVVDAMGIEDVAVLGDMMFARIGARKAAAVVVDGAIRDAGAVLRNALPIFARNTSPASYIGSLRPWSADVPIQCGGVLVVPGDWILADQDGVVVLPSKLVENVADRAMDKRHADAFSQALLRAGFPLDDAYPLPPHMRMFLDPFTTAGVLRSRDQVDQARGSQPNELDGTKD